MDFNEMFQTWKKVLLSPGAEVFVAEREKTSATLGTALKWMIAAAVVYALLGTLQNLVFASAMGGMDQFSDMLPPELAGLATAGSGGGAFGSLALIIVVPIAFLIGTGIFHLIATILGGRGQYGRYAYLLATFGAPIVIVNAVLSFVPLAGACAGLLLLIYYYVLAYHATKVEYGLSQGRAIVAVLLPVVGMVLLIACVAVVAGAALVAAFS